MSKVGKQKQQQKMGRIATGPAQVPPVARFEAELTHECGTRQRLVELVDDQVMESRGRGTPSQAA